MKKTVIALVVTLGLSGCDAAKELGSSVTKQMEGRNNLHQMTLVIRPGYTVVMGGQKVQVFGTDQCPPAGKYIKMLLGPDPEEGGRSCAVIAPDTKAVTVTVGLPSGASTETWTVERKEDQVMLRSADGALLAASE